MKKFFGSALATMLLAGAVLVGSTSAPQQTEADAASFGFSISQVASNNWPF
ncbi:MAG: hypothetical protein Q4P23_16105 [Micrococcaceae bacterium]|nr:hypothetical protein [Micrococcaceae bacterium]